MQKSRVCLQNPRAQVDPDLRPHDSRSSSLSGKVIWITGASSGIGEHMAYCLARAGCHLVLSARRSDELERVKKTCLNQGTGAASDDKNILVLPLDVIDFDKHNEAVQTVIRHFGKIDVLVNNAGRSQMANWMKVELAVDRNLYAINCLGPVSLSQKVIPTMVERGGGHIAVVSSLAGKIGLPGARSYTGSKHAVHGFFESLRSEMADQKIEVTMICPGPVFSQLYRLAATDSSKKLLNREMDPADRRMTASRCAHLSCVAIANRVAETWITRQPILLTMYIVQYAPVFGKIILKLGSKTVMSHREGSDSSAQ